MIIGICKVTIHIPGSATLKDRRKIVNSLKDKIRHNFNVSVAEVENSNLWQKATLGITCVSDQKDYLAQTISGILNMIKNNGEILITDSQIDFL